MPKSYNDILIHAIWTTKHRIWVIDAEVEQVLYNFFFDKFSELGCKLYVTNGMPDHVHCLFHMNPQRSLTETIKKVKGSSSRFINKQDLLVQRFEWQIGYGAFSVSRKDLTRVSNYIRNQKVHHSDSSIIDHLEPGW